LGLVVLGALYVVFAPQVQSTSCNQGQTSCCVNTTSIYGDSEACADCTGAGQCTSTTQTTGGIGGSLLSIAAGVGAIAGVVLVSYVAYRYVSNRPRPGFGNTPPLRQRYRIPFTQPPPPALPAG